jgi:hypothetical protein
MEGGRHDAERTIDNHESAIWITLVSTGLLRAEDAPDYVAHRRRLLASTDGVPPVLEIRHRHGIQPGEEFHMRPGFGNFQRVRRGEMLAMGGAGGAEEIRAPRSGLLLMPRYQELGDDGYFLSQRVHTFWLRVSSVLRRLRFERFLTLLPGVHRHPERPEALRANRRAARWYARDILHLFGYRRKRPEGTWLLFSRRVEGLGFPTRERWRRPARGSAGTR